MPQKLFLQSDEWAQWLEANGREVFNVATDHISAKVVKYKMPFRKNYLYIPYGPVVNFAGITGSIKHEVSQCIAQLKLLAREHNSLFIKIEPQFDAVAEIFADQGFRKPKKETTPHKTVILDITKTEEELLSGMHHKTRYNIGLAEKKGIQIKESDDTKAFFKLIKETAKRNSKTYPLYSAEYYQKFLDFFSKSESHLKAHLFLAYHDDQAIAGAMILIDGDSAYYMFGGSSRAHASLMAPHLLHWQIIKQLKAHDIKLYDLWMIDPIHWPGVTRFKLGWLGRHSLGEGGGGRLVEYPGSFDLPIRRFWYMLYKIYRTVFK